MLMMNGLAGLDPGGKISVPVTTWPNEVAAISYDRFGKVGPTTEQK